MARLSADTWDTIRAEREAGGQSFQDLAQKFGVSHTAIIKRAKAEAWSNGEDVAGVIRRKVSEKVSGIVSGGNPKKKAEAIDSEAERVVEVVRRHRTEIVAVRDTLYAGLKAHKAALTKADKQTAFEDLKAAKISSECMMNIHRLERQAWGLDNGETKDAIIIERRYGL